jgi:T-complex protein 1 subunit alpha
MPSRIQNAKIACLDFNLTRHKMSHGVSIVCEDPTQIDALRERESDIVKERIQMILSAGANVVLTTKGIDDAALKYFIEAGAIAVRRVLKKDIRQIAKACGGMLRALLDATLLLVTNTNAMIDCGVRLADQSSCACESC